MKQTNAEGTRFECANPILSVADMARSLQYYVKVLGFSNAEWGSNEFTCVTRDGAVRIMRPTPNIADMT